MTERLIVETPIGPKIAGHVAPVVTGALLVAALIQVAFRPAHPIRVVTEPSEWWWFYLSLLAVWYYESHLAVTVYTQHDDTLLFKGLFRQWRVAPSSVARWGVPPFPRGVIARHSDGFILLASQIRGYDELAAWISERQRRRGLDPPLESPDARPET